MNEKGQSTLEFALAALLFFTAVFAVIEFALMFYVNLTMQHAVREGTRYVVTGRSDLGSDRRTALIEKIRASSSGLYDKNLHTPKEPSVSVIDPAKVSFSNYTGTPVAGEPGKPNDLIVVRLTYSWPLLTPVLNPFFAGGTYTFTVKTTMRNEPFPLSGS